MVAVLRKPRSGCPIAGALDILGDRWTLVVLRDLLIGGRNYFSELGSAEGIATNVLTERLERLVAAGVIQQHREEDGRRRRYTPTVSGLALIPVLLELAVWGHEHTHAPLMSDMAKRAKTDRDGLEAEIRLAVEGSRK